VNPLLSVVERKLEALPVPVQLVLPDGAVLGPPDPRVRFVTHDKAALAHLAEGAVGVLGQDYVEGRIDIEGNMRDVMAAASALLPGSPVDAARGGWLTELVRKVVSVWRHSVERDAKQIEFHYDLSDDFYALWLDPRRVYSCAYYRTPDMTLAQAQEAKLDHICRKLRLQPGERFLDVGAGSGRLLIWAAGHYGVDATGLEGYFAKLRRLLKPGGLIMNHGITAAGVYNPELGNGMGEFIEKYIFPGGELTHISVVMEAMTNGGLEEVDVENLRPHYARTLWAWSDALEARLPEAAQVLGGEHGARSLRAYRLYLAGCAMAFEHGWIALHQILGQPPATGRSDELDNPADLSYPWRRDYMYDGGRNS